MREKAGGCRQCREDHQFLGKGHPPCAACDPPQLLPGNQAAWNLVEACDVALSDGMGGVNLANLILVADALEIPWDEALIGKIMILARWKMGENLKDLMDDGEQ